MPSNTADQQIPRPVDLDTADNPVAFNASVAAIEPRVVREYTTEADRTARMLVLSQNDVSSLSAPAIGPARLESWDGSNHISLYRHGMYAIVRKTADETISNSTVLQNDDQLLVALPAAGLFMFEMDGLYSSSTVADFKMAYAIPAGATIRWSTVGLATGATSISGDATFDSSTTGSTAVGGAGVSSLVLFRTFGEITMGGTAGNMQFQWAQNTGEVSNTTMRTSSRLQIWRFS